MKLVNCKDPEIGFKIFDMLMPVDTPRVELAYEIKNKMIENPDNVFCCIGQVLDTVTGFLIAYVVGGVVEIRHARTYFASFNYSELIFDILKLWTKSKGVTNILIGTKDKKLRNYYNRVYGFSPLDDNIMRLEL